VALAQLIVERTRDVDVVCRLGGDEIAVLMPACPPMVARRRAEELLTAVRTASFPIEGVEGGLAVSISVGLAHAPSDATDLQRLYSAADEALYQSKRAGRDRLSVAAEPEPLQASPASAVG